MDEKLHVPWILPFVWHGNAKTSSNYFNGNPKGLTSIKLQHIAHWPIPKKWNSYIYGTMFYVGLGTNVWSTTWCVYQMIKSNEISNCVLSQPYRQWDLLPHKQFWHHSNSPTHSICHEPLEVGVGKVMLKHDLIQLCP